MDFVMMQPYRTFEPCHAWRYECEACEAGGRIDPDHETMEYVANRMHALGYEIAQVVVFPGEVTSRFGRDGRAQSDYYTDVRSGPARWLILGRVKP